MSTTAASDLVVTTTANDPEVTAGEPIGFTVAVTNTGTGFAGVGVAATLPSGPGLVWIETSSACLITTITGEPELSCPFVMLSGGETFRVEVTSATTEASCAAYTMAATATPFGGDAVVGTEATVTVTCLEPEVSIALAADAAEVQADSPIGYTITVTNSGAGAATDVGFTDQLPAGFAWTDDQDACAVDETNLLTCAGITLEPDGGAFSVHVTSETTTDDCGSHETTATLSAPYSGGSGTVAVTVVCNEPFLMITMTPDAGTVVAGQPIQFTITVTNGRFARDLGEFGWTLRVATLPGSGWGIVAPHTFDPACTLSGILVCSSGGSPFPANTSRTVTVSRPTTLDDCNTTIVSGVLIEVARLDGNGNPIPAQNPSPETPYETQFLGDDGSVTVVCPEPEPELAITTTADAASVDAGQPIGFTIDVTNTGFGPADDVTFTAPIPTGPGLAWSETEDACAIDAWVLACTIDLTAAGDGGDAFSVHVTSPTTVGSCGSYETIATLSEPYSGGSGPIGIEVVCGDISLVKTADAPWVLAGNPIGYTITVTNHTSSLRGVAITDALPGGPGLDWTETSSSCRIVGGDTLSCPFVLLAGGSSRSFHVTSATTPESCGTYANVAGARVFGGGSIESAEATTEVLCETTLAVAVDPVGETVAPGGSAPSS